MAQSVVGVDYWRFLEDFARARGAPEILAITSLLSLAVGATAALVPAACADRFARRAFGYDGPPCGGFDPASRPRSCQQGSDMAQDAAMWSNLVLCLLLLLGSPIVGSASDTSGRRCTIRLALLLALLPAAAFLLLLHRQCLSPVWYYAANSLAGSVNLLSLVFAALADVVAPAARGPAFGLIMAGYYGGFALGPSLAVLLDPAQCAVASLLLLALALTVGMLRLPETRPLEQRHLTVAERLEEDTEEAHDMLSSWLARVSRAAARPFRDIAILNRNRTLRLLAAGSFFSAMVFASDATLALYYIEDQLSLRADDMAELFLVLGIFGIVCQAGLLQPLTALLGEKALLVATFGCGVCHNLLYGVARTKYGIMAVFGLSQLTKLNFPLLASLASQSAAAHEQGRVQGALFATNAVANALGPLVMEYVYERTEYSPNYGPGFMWLCAAFLYLVGTIVVAQIPMKPAPAVDTLSGSSGAAEDVERDEPQFSPTDSSLQEPLLPAALSASVI